MVVIAIERHCVLDNIRPARSKLVLANLLDSVRTKIFI